MGAVAAGARQKRQGMAFSMVCSSSFLDLAIPPRTLHCGHSYPIPSTLFLPSPLHWGALGAGEGGAELPVAHLCSPVPSPPYPPVCATQTLMRRAEAVSVPQLGCPVLLPSLTLSTGVPNRLSFRHSTVAPLNSEATHTLLAFSLPVFSLPLTPFFPKPSGHTGSQTTSSILCHLPNSCLGVRFCRSAGSTWTGLGRST